MHSEARHRTPSLTSLPKDGEVNCEFRPPRSPIRSLTSLDRAQLQSPDENCISRSVTQPANVKGRKALRTDEVPRKEEQGRSVLKISRSNRNASLITGSLFQRKNCGSAFR